MLVRYDKQAKPIRHRSRRYPKIHRDFMDYHVKRLEEYYRNQNARYVSPGYVVPKDKNPTDITTDFRFTIDSREPNKLAIDGQWPMPIIEQCQEHLAGAKYFIILDMKDGYWQCPLAEESQELYSFATHSGVWTPRRVMMGASGSVLYFQATMQSCFEEVLYKNLIVWVDDLMLYATTVEELFGTLKKVPEVCRTKGLKLSVSKCILFSRQLKWCGKIVSAEGISNDPERIRALQEMTTPVTAADLMYFLNAANWIRTSIPCYADVFRPLQDKLKNCMGKTHARRKMPEG